MIDCTKSITDLTPIEAFQCVIHADQWTVIGGNLRHVWANFTGTTIGEWLEMFFAFAHLPAMFGSFVWPVVLVAFLRNEGFQRVDGRAKWFGFYTVVCGVIIVLLNFRFADPFMLYIGLWEIGCGISMIIFGWIFEIRRRRKADRPAYLALSSDSKNRTHDQPSVAPPSL